MHRIFILMLVGLMSCEQNRSEYIAPVNPNIKTVVNPNPNPAAELRYLALGDSYTIGQSVDASERWPVQLTALLRESGYNYKDPRIVARTGWTTDQLETAIDDANIQEKYDLVTLLIGVNDQYRGRNVEDFRTRYIDVLNKAIALANNNPKNVIVVSIPDWGVSPFAENRDRDKISQEIDLYNRVKKEETIKKQVQFINITAISRQALNNDSYIASDNLHFSGAMYKLWANEILSKGF